MQKKTKAGIAAGGAAALLLGGLGTTALWQVEAGSEGGTVTTGFLGITSNEDGEWEDLNPLIPGDDEWTSTDRLVPGDRVALTETFEIEAVGKNLQLAVDWDYADGEGDTELPDDISVEVDSFAINDPEATVTGDSITGITPGDHTLTATVVVEFEDSGDFNQPTGPADEEVIDLTALDIVVSQVR